MNHFVNTLAIRRWADQLTARSSLPQVLRRLVHATVPDISAIDFPAHESVQRSGFDGVVVCGTGNAWVPAGRSVWELGTNRDVKGKADDDFEKRTAETPEVEQLETTYVAVTPRHWENKTQWAKDHVGKGKWKEIRAYDADDLEQWLETAPAVAAWFGIAIGTRPADVDDLESRWTSISTATTHSLIPEVFLASRDQAIQQIRQWLRGPPDLLAIATRSPVEAIDFFAALAASFEDGERTPVVARTIIVESAAAWKMLRDNPTPTVLVVDPSINLTAEETNRAVTKGHHVFTVAEPSTRSQRTAIELGRAPQHELSSALESCGYPPSEAGQYARASAGSLAILKRRLAKFPSSSRPEWATHVPPDALRACLLIGGWDDANVADRVALEALAGRRYEELEGTFQLLATCRDPLLLHAAGRWRIISKDEAWALFGNQVPASAFSAFEGIALDVLADDDPRYHLPAQERHLASIKGHVPKNSGTIKDHVAETLALLGTIGGSLEATASTDIPRTVDQIVAKILATDVTWHRWASLGSRLTMLAEASPSAFLKAIKSDLENPDPKLPVLFQDEGDSFFSRCNHAGLLWALEKLAWSKSLLPDVCRILLQLDERDTSKRFANRPRESLGQILSYWLPQTSADVNERILVLDLLLKQSASAGWRILLDLLPRAAGGVSMPTQKPYWRDWAQGWNRGATYADMDKFVVAVTERLIKHAGTDPEQMTLLIRNIGQLPRGLLPELIASLEGIAAYNPDDAVRRPLADELSKQINLHRRFSDAQWALPAETVERLGPVCDSLRPVSLTVRHAWLFQQCPDRYFGTSQDYNEGQKELAAARTEAILAIVAEQNFGGIEELLVHAESPDVVGWVLADAVGDRYLDSLIPAKLCGSPREREMALTFIQRRFKLSGWAWGDPALALCNTEESRAWFFVAMPFSSETWTRLNAAGAAVASLYWSRCSGFNPDLPIDDIGTAVRSFVQAHRPGAAVQLLSWGRHDKEKIGVNTLCLPLTALLSLPPEHAEREAKAVDAHAIADILENLQARESEVDLDRMARLEFHFLKVLDRHSGNTPKTLMRYLATRPEFFVEVLSHCFRSEHDNDEEVPVTDQQQYFASRGIELLQEWDAVPGKQADGTIDEATLQAWCQQTRQLAEQAGRLGVCDNYIGQVFAHAPADPDGTWPCMAVRRVAEEIHSRSLGSGLFCGIKNARGLVARARGGDQERQLAQQFKERAARIRYDSPFAADVLDDVAGSYEREARSWDETDRWEE